MHLTACFRQGNLLLTLSEPALVGLSRLVKTLMTTDPGFVMRMQFILGQNRLTASMTQLMRAGFQPVPNAHAPIEDKA